MATVSGKTLESVRGIYHNTLNELLEGNDEFVLLNHYGEFSQEKMDAVLTIVEDAILESGGKRRIMKRICSILIESFQNVSKHGALQSGRKMGFVILTQSESGYRILCGNLMHNEDVRPLESKIKLINSLNSNELRKLYIETLCNENFTNKGGAGLGFLTVAKKSERPLQFTIEQLSENLSFFTLFTSVNEK